MVRMLWEEERKMLALRGNVQSWEAHRVIQNLKEFQRVTVVQVSARVFDFENTEMGEKALRVDALIRAQGVAV